MQSSKMVIILIINLNHIKKPIYIYIYLYAYKLYVLCITVTVINCHYMTFS